MNYKIYAIWNKDRDSFQPCNGANQIFTSKEEAEKVYKGLVSLFPFPIFQLMEIKILKEASPQ